MFPRMTALERDLTRIGLTVVAVAATIGGAIGWVAHELVTHLHDPTPSEHFRR